MYHCPPFVQSVVSYDSASGQEGPDQTAQMRSPSRTLADLICLKRGFCMGRPIYVFV